MTSKIDYSKWSDIDCDDDVIESVNVAVKSGGNHETQSFRLYVSTLHNQAGRRFVEAVRTNNSKIYMEVEQAYREIIRIMQDASYETLKLLEPHQHGVFISSMLNLIASLCKQDKHTDALLQCKLLSDYNAELDAKQKMKREEEVKYLYFHLSSLLGLVSSSMEEDVTSLRTCDTLLKDMHNLVKSAPTTHESYASLVSDYEQIRERVRANRERLSLSVLWAVQGILQRELHPLREEGKLSLLEGQARERVRQGVLKVLEG
ncbi:hypothetical protein EON65_49025, partial [archaeon]